MKMKACGPHQEATAAPDVRVLRRLDVQAGPTGEGMSRGDHVAVVLDVETTGLDVERDAIIELAIRRFRYDADGVITDIDRAYEWREDPGRPISPEITALTGIADADVVGRSIADDVATRLLSSASVVIAHNSRFDRRWVEKRLPEVPGLAWICSMSQIDWRSRGFDGRGLGYLLCQAGWFHDGHRAIADVDAVIQLLRHRFEDGTTAFAELRETGAKPTWMIRAVGAAFAVKDILRERVYRWDGERKVWWREVADDARIGEEFWLAANVYDVRLDPKTLGPSIERIDAHSRFL